VKFSWSWFVSDVIFITIIIIYVLIYYKHRTQGTLFDTLKLMSIITVNKTHRKSKSKVQTVSLKILI